jgi:ribosomal protein S27AE
MYGLFYELRQSREIDQARGRAIRAESRSEQLKWDVRAICDRIDKLTLICMAMWSLLEDYTDLKEEDLLKRVEEFDLRDGVPDGKVTKQIARCPKCDRVMSPKHNKCLYCGAGKLTRSPFDAV